MSGTRARIEAAIEKLSAARAETVESGKVASETVVMMVRTLPGLLRILQNDLAVLDSCKTDEQRATFESAFLRAGDAAVVDVLLDAASPDSGSERHT